MKRHCICSLFVLLITGMICRGFGAPPQGVDLAALNGWDILVAQDAIPSELYAAQEFQNFFAQASGRRLPIVKVTDRPDRHIFIGPSLAMAKSGVGFKPDSFGPEDLRIVIRDNNIAIAGGRPRGTLYGVYTFLEDYMGVRFLAVDHTYVPKVDGWRVVGPVDRFYHPPLAFRWSFYSETDDNPAFAARLRTNTVPEDPNLGGKTPLELVTHSFGWQIPPSKYGKEHPEYFSLIDGKRRAQVPSDYDWTGTQPCLTNPEVLRIVTKAVLDQLAAKPNLVNVSVSQIDNQYYCRCPRCAAIDAREGTPMGSLLTFVNSVADAVARKHPGVTVGTLSYQYSRKPPKYLRPRPNVQIQLCSIECCMVHAINDPKCPKNVAFCRDLADWGKISNNISIWNYDVNFFDYLLPCPNLRAMEPNIRYFVVNHTQGVLMEAAYNSNGTELSDLRNYLMANLLWDPNRSGRQLMDEFISLHYGRAGEPIRRFIELCHDHVEAAGVHPDCFGRSAADFGIDETVAQAGLDAFVRAMTLAESQAVRTRVEKASICAYRAAIEPIWSHKLDKPLDPLLAQRMRPLVRRYFELSRKYNVVMARERITLDETEQRLKKIFGLSPKDAF